MVHETKGGVHTSGGRVVGLESEYINSPPRDLNRSCGGPVVRESRCTGEDKKGGVEHRGRIFNTERRGKYI